MSLGSLLGQRRDEQYPHYAPGPGITEAAATRRSGEPPGQLNRHVPSGPGWPGSPADQR